MEEDKPDLLFVNKTQDSHDLSNSKGDEKYAILSHVQSIRRKKQRKRKLKESKPPPWQQYTSLINPEKHTGLPAAGSSQKISNSPEPKQAPSGSRYDSDQDLPSTKDQIQRVMTRLAQVYPSQNAADPFYTTAGGVQITATHHALLYFTFKYTARANFLAEAFAPQSVIARREKMRHDHGMVERLRNCIEHDHLLYSTLAYASSFLSWMAGVSLEGHTPEYFVAKALPALRMQLSKYGSEKNPDTWALFSLYSLSVSNTWDVMPRLWISNCPSRYRYLQSMMDTRAEATSQGARAHLKAISYFVEKAGGWNTVDSYLMESIIMAGKYLSLWDLELPIVHYSAFDPGAMRAEMREKLNVPEGTFPRLGRGFIQAAICSDLQEIVEQAVDFIRLSVHAWSIPTITAEVETWLFLRLHAIIYRLLFLDSANLSPMNNSMRLAIIAFLLSGINHFGSKLCATDMVASYLRRALENFNPPVEDEQSSRIRLWCLSMGAMSTWPSSSDREWYIRATATLTPSILPECSEGCFQTELESFLFLPSQQASELSALVADVVSWR